MAGHRRGDQGEGWQDRPLQSCTKLESSRLRQGDRKMEMAGPSPRSPSSGLARDRDYIPILFTLMSAEQTI